MLIEARRQTDDWRYWHIGELIWSFFMVDCHLNPREFIRLWHNADGNLIGYALLGDGPYFDCQVLPGYVWRGIETEALVAAAVCTIFEQPNRKLARRQLQEVYKVMDTRWPKAAELLVDVDEDILAYMLLPQEPLKRIYSNNPLERMHKEIKRRTNVVGIFPNKGSIMRLVEAILLEQADEW